MSTPDRVEYDGRTHGHDQQEWRAQEWLAFFAIGSEQSPDEAERGREQAAGT